MVASSGRSGLWGFLWRGWARARADRALTGAARRPCRPAVLVLESRLAPATFNPLPGTPDGTSNGSLRADVIAANANGQDNVINLSAGLYRLDIGNSNGHEGAAAQGDLNLTAAGHTIVFQGAGPDRTVIDAAYLDRAFQVSANVTAVFRDLTIVNGWARDNGTPGALPGSSAALGGGILSQGGNVTLDDVWIESCRAQGSASAAGSGGAAAFGAGIYAQGGSLTILNSTLRSDAADGGAGGAGNPGNDGGSGGGARGGGVFADGPVTIVNSTFTYDYAFGAQGGDGGNGTASSAPGAGGAGGAAAGGALCLVSGTTTISDSSIFYCGAQGGNGGAGGQPTSVGTGAAGGNGGAGWGGAIYVQAGTLTLSNSTLDLNSASGGGGGNGGAAGPSPSGGTGGNAGESRGGGLLVQGTANLHNSTFTQNYANASKGGAAGAGGGGTAGADNLPAGGGVFNAGGTVNAISSLFADNYVYAPGTDRDISGNFNTASHNLLSDNQGSNLADSGRDASGHPLPDANGNLVGTPDHGIDAKLRFPDYYGGPTQTFALYGDSPAIDHGSNPDGLTTDQRGYGPRAVNGVADIGAFEFGASAPAPPPPPPPPPPPFVQLVYRIVNVKGRPRLDVSDAATGASRLRLFPFGNYRGKLRVMMADLNGDGVGDLLVLTTTGPLRLRAFDGHSLGPLPV
jgi:hypothetical protein